MKWMWLWLSNIFGLLWMFGNIFRLVYLVHIDFLVFQLLQMLILRLVQIALSHCSLLLGLVTGILELNLWLNEVCILDKISKLWFRNETLVWELSGLYFDIFLCDPYVYWWYKEYVEGAKRQGVLKPTAPMKSGHLPSKGGYFIIQLILFTISWIVVSKSFSIGRLNHDAWMCHHPPNSAAIFDISVFFDLIEHLMLSHSFLIVIVIFGQRISWITVNQYQACSLSIQWSCSSPTS